MYFKGFLHLCMEPSFKILISINQHLLFLNKRFEGQCEVVNSPLPQNFKTVSKLTLIIFVILTYWNSSLSAFKIFIAKAGCPFRLVNEERRPREEGVHSRGLHQRLPGQNKGRPGRGQSPTGLGRGPQSRPRNVVEPAEQSGPGCLGRRSRQRK